MKINATFVITNGNGVLIDMHEIMHKYKKAKEHERRRRKEDTRKWSDVYEIFDIAMKKWDLVSLNERE